MGMLRSTKRGMFRNFYASVKTGVLSHGSNASTLVVTRVKIAIVRKLASWSSRLNPLTQSRRTTTLKSRWNASSRSFHAHVRNHPGQHNRVDAQSAQQRLQRCVMKGTVSRLLDLVIRGWHFRYDVRTPGAAPQPFLSQKRPRMLHDETGIDRIPMGIAPPHHSDVNDRNAGLFWHVSPRRRPAQ